VALMATPVKMNKVKTGTNAVIFVVLMLFGLGAVNVIAGKYYKRLDYTEDHIYTLSQPSKDLVAKLPDRMTVKAFISSDLQPPFSQTAQYVRDLVAEYAAASKGKLHWEVVDPGSDPKLEEEAQKFKVPKMRRGRVSSSKVEIGSSYLGLALQYQGNIESIPEINATEGLEFQITSLIKIMTVKKKKIAFATSEGELSPEAGNPQQHGGGGGLQTVRQYMADYDVVTVQLNQGAKPLADDVDALVIAGPKTQMSERAKFVVDQFLMKGKAVAFFMNGMVIETPRGMPGMEQQPRIGRKNDVGAEDLLESYGFKLHDDIILEPRQNGKGPLVVGGQLFLANYPTFVGVTDLAPKSGITDRIKAVVLPFASSVEQVAGSKTVGEITPLLKSTPDAWRQTGFFLLDPERTQLKPTEDHGPFVYAFAVKATKMTSFFAGKPYPNEKGEKVAAVSGVSTDEQPLDQSTGTPRLIVMGEANFASDEYARFARNEPVYGLNVLMFINMMDFLVADEALAPLRAKTVAARPIKVDKESTVNIVKFGNVVGVPFVFVLFGIVRWRIRRARRLSAKL